MGDIFFGWGMVVRREERHAARLAEMLTEVCHRLTGRTGTGDWQLRELLEDLKQPLRLKKRKIDAGEISVGCKCEKNT